MMLLEILIIVVAIRMVVTLWAELMHLLRTCSKLAQPIITSHWDCQIVSKSIKNITLYAYSAQDLVAVRNWELPFHTGDPGSYQDSFHI